jgi:hypothetical protein
LIFSGDFDFEVWLDEPIFSGDFDFVIFFIVMTGVEFVLDVVASALRGVTLSGSGVSSSVEHRSITSLLALAAFADRAVRLGALLGEGDFDAGG